MPHRPPSSGRSCFESSHEAPERHALGLSYVEASPPRDLAAAVDRFWILRGPAAAPAERVLPDGSVELVFDLGAPFRRVLADGTVVLQPQGLLVGPTTRPVHLVGSGRVDLLGVRFRPGGAAALVPSPLEELTDAMLPVEDLLGSRARELTDSLLGEAEPSRRLDLVAELLRGVLRPTRIDATVAAAVASLSRGAGAVAIGALCRRLGVSPRTLERSFRRQVGMPPKLLARLARFQSVLRHGRSRAALVALALDAGYYDEPHLLRDFREFVGTTPREYFRPERNVMSRLLVHGAGSS